MKIVSDGPHRKTAALLWSCVALALAGCATNNEYEAMRERAIKAESERDQMAAYALKQREYIQQLQRGMELQAYETAKLREGCAI